MTRISLGFTLQTARPDSKPENPPRAWELFYTGTLWRLSRAVRHQSQAVDVSPFVLRLKK